MPRRIVNTKAITVSTAVQTSAVTDTYVNEVLLSSDVACYINIGKNATSTTTSFLLPADTVEGFAISKGQNVAVLEVSGGGTLHIAEINS